MTKVGYVVKRYPRYSETFIVNEILSHERAGLDIDIFALRPSVDTHFQSILSEVRAPVHYLDTPSRATEFWSRVAAASERFPRIWEALPAATRMAARDVCQAIHLAQLAADRGVAHLHAHFATSATDVARLASLISNIPFSFTAHAKDIFHEEVDDISLGDKLRDAAFTVTVSDFNVKFLADKFDDDAARVRRIYNGLNLQEFSYESPAQRELEILAVGRLVEKKGFDVLVDACAVLHHKGTKFTCTIVGEGDQRLALEERIDELQLEDVVRLVGPRPRNEVMAMIRRAAVMAVPCVIGSDGNQDGL
ncbi:MAG: glycosyltransferase, partial [Rhodothermales bacterium]|nr:glycosyltransferase [Rhodothermales bacterium]